jgi:hypothetical protein
VPGFSVTGSQVNGWAMPDPGFAAPALNSTAQSWVSGTEQPGTYSAQVRITGTNPGQCYFMAGGVYDFTQGFSQNAGFVSNELRPPDEPALYLDSSSGLVKPVRTTTTAALSGSISSIAVAALPAAITASTSQQNSYVSVGGQNFIVSTAGAAAGATSIPLKGNQSVTGTIPSGSLLTVRQFVQFWDANGVNCAGSPFVLSATGTTGLTAGTYSIELTSARWAPNGVPSCSGPVSATCYLRESAPSMCKTVTLGVSSVIQLTAVPSMPGAQDYYVYLASNGNCTGLTYCTNLGSGNSSVTINNSTCATGGRAVPDQQGLPVGPGLPNANPPAGTPPSGDLGNERHCVDPSNGNNIACPGPSGTITPGAVTMFIPGPGSNQQCLNLQGGGDIYVFSGYQYQRVLLFEPGPEQAPPANTCPNNVAGHGLTSLIGIFYLPAASVVITGNSAYFATIAGGVISWTATVQGNGGVSISADPTLRSWPPTVKLVQ